jgi:DNA (cytosine-5)-methyltransferase 1
MSKKWFDSSGLTPHPNGNGLNGSNCEHEKQPGKGGEYALSNANTGNDYADVADGKLERRRFGFNNSGNAWEKFPTVSPICNGDDGLSDRLDSITFPKWRQESIKAGGNAIVPQVALCIFRAIQEYEKKYNG